MKYRLPFAKSTWPGTMLGFLFVYFLFFFVAPAEFHSLYNTKTLVSQSVIYGIGALGMTFVIISGGIDLSAGSMIALGTVATARLLQLGTVGEMGFLLPMLAACAGILTCSLVGVANGAMTSLLRIHPFIITLGMMQIARGAAIGIAGQTMVNCPPNWLNGLMVVEPRVGAWHSVAPGIWLMLVLLIATVVLLRLTVFGRHVVAIGSNEATARLCGVRVQITRIAVYGLSGALIGIASVMQYAKLSQGDPTAAIGMELDIIAAVVVGGGSLNGGKGSLLGTLFGALIMAVLRNGCNLVGIPNFVQNIVIGAIIIAAVGIDRLRQVFSS